MDFAALTNTVLEDAARNRYAVWGICDAGSM